VWFGVCGLWFVVCGLWFVVCGLRFGVWGLGSVVCGLGFSPRMVKLEGHTLRARPKRDPAAKVRSCCLSEG